MMRDGMWSFHLNHFFNVADALAMACFDFLAKTGNGNNTDRTRERCREFRLDGPAPRITRSGHRAHRRAVIAAIARNDFVAPGDKARHFMAFSLASEPPRVKNVFANPVTSESFLPSVPRGSVAKLGPAKQSSSTCFLIASSILDAGGRHSD